MRYTHVRQSLNSKGEILPISDVEKFIKNQEVDHYSNLFTFDSSVVEYFNKNNSIAGYNGKATTNKLVFDFDSKENIELAKEDVTNLLAKLQAVGVNIIDSVEVFWSGNKGFHVEVLTSREFVPEEVKSICTNFAGETSSLDPSIYSIVRAFRLPNTAHNVTGLYKVSLNYDELSKSIEEIKLLAKQPRPVKKLIPTNVDFSLYIKPKERKLRSVVVSEEIDGIRGLDHIDFRHCPASTPRCYFALSRGVMQPGERSRIFHIMAKFYRNQGMVKETAYHLLKGIAELNSVLYPESDKITKEEIWNQHIASAYSSTSIEFLNPKGTGTSADNELLVKYCKAIKSSCKCTLHKAQASSIMRIDEVSDTYEKFASDLSNNLVKTGIKFIDDNMQITTGTTTLLVGSTGCGKTSAALSILENSNKMNQHSLFFSLDMHRTLVYQKIAQKLTDYSGKEIQRFYQSKDKKKIEEIKEVIAKHYGKTFFDFSSALTLDEMRDRVLSTEISQNCKIKLVIVDYAGRISGPYSDIYANAGYNAVKSTGIADETNAAWVYLAQISRQVGDSNIPLRSKRVAKESSNWEESATNVITMWRPFAGMREKDCVVRMFLAKSRMNSEIEEVLGWDGARHGVFDLTPKQYEEYEMNFLPEESLLKPGFHKK